MGKASRSSKHATKMKLKRAKKAARKTQYESLAGTSKKNKNQKRKQKLAGSAKHQHKMAMCGNTGCKKCFLTLNLSPHPTLVSVFEPRIVV